ncbi:alpha-E domain-containing protein [Roseovarius sp. SCSIO 43702]|uniref:alpha-E domain-containing protein n=1 Tax=Roseovarius sp. SCSIO 43702 TaxID=2823043 RepID=UPI001C739D1F|nr:alpha-E domain-containing protein [Roseovarius sp. SCSIO 43702]QYX56254.1 alpha-E domain-containing protein [Roseovarius sp. SCSIO 43702]
MLGKTAGGLYWMFRSLERAENTARLIEAGFRIALTRSTEAEGEWKSVIVTSAAQAAYEAKHDGYNSAQVTNFLLRDPDNPGSVLSSVKIARDNARLVRTALTTEVWSAVNETWMLLVDLLAKPVKETELPEVLAAIRHQCALVRGALTGTMLRKDSYHFCQLGIHIERTDSTARIIDVKYHALLPASSLVGGRLDNVQWETLLRSVSAHRAFRWAVEGDYTAPAIAEFLILDRRMPRSLSFCVAQIVASLGYLADDYGERVRTHELADALNARLEKRDIAAIFDEGLHEFLGSVIRDVAALGQQLEQDYRFNR